MEEAASSIVLERLLRFLYRLEGILHQQVHAVGMVGGVIEIRTPAAQVFSGYLHIGGDIPKQVCYEILPIAVSGRFVGRIPVFRVKA